MNRTLYDRTIFIWKAALIVVLSLFLAFFDFQYFVSIGPSIAKVAYAADVTITPTANTSAAAQISAGATTVFISDQVGYRFFRTREAGKNGQCSYRKTTDGGVNWSVDTVVDSQTDCGGIAVWHDQWTPGDTGSYIHIVTMEIGAPSDALWYNRLDTDSDTLLMGSSPVNISTNSGQGGSFTTGATKPSIAKGTDGTVYVAISDNSDSFVVECSASCGSELSWTETGTNPLDRVNNDFNLMVPLLGGDVLLINRDASADDIRSKIWNNTSWSGSWSLVDNNALDNTAYDIGMSAAYDAVSGEVMLVYVADNENFTSADHDIRSARFTGSSWVTGADLVTDDTRGITGVAIGIDENTGEIYVSYSARSTIGTPATADVFWATTTNALGGWGVEQGPVNTTSGDIFGIDMNAVNDQRLYVSWFEAGTDAIYGDTILDTSPATIVTATGTQVAVVRASTTTQYIGGTFVISEFAASRSVNSITLTENGTIDGATDIRNVRLYYDIDSSLPYNCESESFDGSESTYGTVDANGFSGADGVSSFTGSVTISPTQTMCVYPVLDVARSAVDGATVQLEIADPSTDIIVSGVIATPPVTVTLSGTTTVSAAPIILDHYHWRNDDGTEISASSATGGSEDTALDSLSREVPKRLRIGLHNDGSTTTISTQLQLQFGTPTPTCDVASDWVAVEAVDDDFNMSPSANVSHGDNTTEVSVANGGVSSSDTSFLVSNSGIRTTSDTSEPLAIDSDEYAILEYSIIASSSATQGQSYCFRLVEDGEPLSGYTVYPQATIASDVTVSALGIHTPSAEIPESDVYFGGTLVVSEQGAGRNITALTLLESGTIDASAGLDNVALYYDLDTSDPYNCVSESYGGSEPQYGATTTFDGVDGNASFTGSLAITSTSTACFYVVADVTGIAQSNQTVSFSINDPSADISVTGGGSISPSTPIAVASSTAVAGALVSQTNYHWRNDDGSETGATSATGGAQNTEVTGFGKSEPIRLRLALANQGGTSSLPSAYTLQFGIKISTCESIAAWTTIDAATNDSWDLFNSTFLTHGDNTTNIPIGDGGVSDYLSPVNFISSNEGVRETTDTSATTTMLANEFIELEYSLTSTINTPFETDFCFRVTENELPLVSYDVYPQITTKEKRDFKIQQATSIVSGVGATILTAGIDYEAPAATSSAFVRITNAYQTGAGDIFGGGNQDTDNVTAYLEVSDLTSSFSIVRDTDSINETFVSWEIIEFIGDPGTDNEMIVHDSNDFALSAAQSISTSSPITGIADDSDVVVFVTGVLGRSNGRATYSDLQVTSEWSSSTNEAVFRRDAATAAAAVSYAVVEFTGENWNIQRVEHNYTAAGTYETEDIDELLNSTTRAFLYTQKRHVNNINQADFGHIVSLGSVGSVTFYLEPLTTTPSDHTSVAWIIENTQVGIGEMKVYQNSGFVLGGAEPSAFSISGWGEVNAISNASIFAMSATNQVGTNYPRVIGSFMMTATSTFQLWRSDTTGVALDYSAEVVEWPAADVAYRQNYYRFYDDEDALTPSDPWPAGATDLGENTPITSTDEPLAEGDKLRVRMTVRVSNGTLPANLQTFKLQYGVQNNSCSAVSTWQDVGAVSSGVVWRGYDIGGVLDGASLSINPPSGGDLLISVSDRAGTVEEENNTAVNPYDVNSGEDFEFDFALEQNGALQRTTYCFRLVRGDGTPLSAYLNYPQIRTNGYAPVTEAWRWYDDELSETPVVALAPEEAAPSGIVKGNTVTLRVTVDEVNNLSQDNTRFKLQYADNPSFTAAVDVAATSTCGGSDAWCYANGGGLDNATITTALLSTSDACIAASGPGCGTYGESPLQINGFRHSAFTAQEYDYTIQYQNIPERFGQVWYFRLYDILNETPVPINTGYTYPSLVGESGSLSFTIGGVNSGTTTEGIVTDVTTTPTTVPFGNLTVGGEYEAAHRITVDTDAVFGYKVMKYTTQALQNDSGGVIADVVATNESPAPWSTACATQSSCFGYHAGDDILDGVSTRFAADDSYAAFSSNPETIMYSVTPTTDVEDVVYRVKINQSQAPGDYQTNVVYVAVPVF